mmetsp:Transcript_42935/g.97037  ORF Transcript_42935/g.97037 Transcript_42935/m.97037 type:complete len:88 (-) Transcript_42935:13-276(-)
MFCELYEYATAAACARGRTATVDCALRDIVWTQVTCTCACRMCMHTFDDMTNTACTVMCNLHSARLTDTLDTVHSDLCAVCATRQAF